MNASQDGQGFDDADAAALRNALVRFLVESSFDGTRQAKVVDDLLDAVRGLPGQYADLTNRLDKRTESLERRTQNLDAAIVMVAEKVEQLSSQLRNSPETVTKQINAALQAVVKEAKRQDERVEEFRKLATGALRDSLSAVESVKSVAADSLRVVSRDARLQVGLPNEAQVKDAKALRPQSPHTPQSKPSSNVVVWTVLILFLSIGLVASGITNLVLLRNQAALPGIRSAASPPSAAQKPVVTQPPEPMKPSHEVSSGTIQSANESNADPSVRVSPPILGSAKQAWTRLWNAALQVSVTSCADSSSRATPGNDALGKCICPGIHSNESCTPRAARDKGMSTQAMQAILKVYSPNSSIQEIDGRLGKVTLNALLEMATKCGPDVSRPATKLQQDWQNAMATRTSNKQSFDPRDDIEKILGALKNDPQECLDTYSDNHQ
jgi:hypothetical protein